MVLSAPSGAGKTTLRDALRSKADFFYAVSYTTRPARPGEIEGEDYHFVDDAEFERIARGDGFLEHATVHSHRYGTPRHAVLESLRAGRDVLLDIDTAGAANIRQCRDPEIMAALADVFLMPPPLEELRRRLETRGTESAGEIQTRLRNAERELRHWRDYRYVIPAGSIDQTYQTFVSILRAERCLTRRCSGALCP